MDIATNMIMTDDQRDQIIEMATMIRVLAEKHQSLMPIRELLYNLDLVVTPPETTEKRTTRIGPHLAYTRMGDKEMAVSILLYGQGRITRGPVIDGSGFTEEWMYSDSYVAFVRFQEWIYQDNGAGMPLAWTRYTNTRTGERLRCKDGEIYEDKGE